MPTDIPIPLPEKLNLTAPNLTLLANEIPMQTSPSCDSCNGCLRCQTDVVYQIQVIQVRLELLLGFIFDAEFSAE